MTGFHYQSTQHMLTGNGNSGHPSTWAVNSGSGNRALGVGKNGRPFRAAVRSGTPGFPCQTVTVARSRSSAVKYCSGCLVSRPLCPRKTTDFEAV